MKAIIALALKGLIKDKFGDEKWEAVLKNAGIDNEPRLTPISDIDDKVVLDVIGSACKVLDISSVQAADAFGEYWMTEYAPQIFKHYFSAKKNAKEFLLKMDDVHVAVTNTTENARPPRFDYEWEDKNTLIMNYKSDRNLIDIFVGLIKGVGKYYNENLQVSKAGGNKVKVIFA